MDLATIVIGIALLFFVGAMLTAIWIAIQDGQAYHPPPPPRPRLRDRIRAGMERTRDRIRPAVEYLAIGMAIVGWVFLGCVLSALPFAFAYVFLKGMGW